MSLTLANLRTKAVVQPPRFLIYGPPGLGKTELASEFPSPIFLDVENGLPPGKEVANFADLAGFDAVMDAITALYNEDHDYGTLVIDTVDRLEPMVWAKACEDNKWPSIEAPGYGKGYVEADRYWRELIDGANALRRDKGMAIVYVAHSTIDRFDSPTSASYSRFDVRLHKRALAIVQDEVDAILFLNQDASIKQEDQGFNKKRAHAEGGGTRWVYCEQRPAWVAKNRFDLPDRFIYRRGEGFAEIAKHLPGGSGGEVTETKPRVRVAAAQSEAA